MEFSFGWMFHLLILLVMHREYQVDCASTFELRVQTTGLPAGSPPSTPTPTQAAHGPRRTPSDLKIDSISAPTPSSALASPYEDLWRRGLTIVGAPGTSASNSHQSPKTPTPPHPQLTIPRVTVSYGDATRSGNDPHTTPTPTSSARSFNTAVTSFLTSQMILDMITSSTHGSYDAHEHEHEHAHEPRLLEQKSHEELLFQYSSREGKSFSARIYHFLQLR